MTPASRMKLFGGRHMGCIVERIEWNKNMDLLAYVTEKGEVVVQRLNWKKVATFPTPVEGVKVRSLSWQLDDSVLAVGYSNGKVALLDVENETVISSVIYDDDDVRQVYFSGTIDCPETLGGHTFNANDKHKLFLPKPWPLPAIDPSLRTLEQKPFPEGSPRFLIVVLCSGKVHLLLFAAVQTGSIDLTQYVLHPEQFEVFDVKISGDFNAIYALVRDGQQLKMLHFRNQLLQDFKASILGVARLCAHILETKNYINRTEQCLKETWEAVQLVMDNRLTNYANAQAYGSTSADLLELHIFGFSTLEVEELLTMSERELKKIAKSAERGFRDLHALVFKPLNEAAISMFYFLNAITGLARMPHFYESLLLPEMAVEAMRACGSFYLKVFELRERIHTLANDSKLFHNWLLFTILRLSHQEIPDEMLLSKEENAALADLLCSMEPDSDDSSDDKAEPELGEAFSLPSSRSTRSLFNIDQVGQYLKNAFLTQPHPVDPNHLWDEIERESNYMGASNVFVPHDKKLSLVQQREKMFNAIDGILYRPTESISASFKLSSSIICREFRTVEPEKDQDFLAFSYHANDSAKCDMFAVTISCEEAMILQFSWAEDCLFRCTRVHLKPGPFTQLLDEEYNNLRIVDLKFYNESILSVLTQSMSYPKGVRPHSCLIQLSLSELENHCSRHHLAALVNLTDVAESRSIHDISDKTAFKLLDGVCTMLAVSSGRRVVTVLSDSKRKLTIFETEVEETYDTDAFQGSFLQISRDQNASISDAEQLDSARL
ncbi:anaphase-promoting complex subunit 4-like [Drosophila miranda]|uniref:anaphase-promoting complex subunit 4-like n=1 Tax=Drosophila miranda TaxID=7229 RepID=UPI0007E6F67B|nr:anaphase-promoting complex subunit 4-like [Drosophila miranda]XP_033245478.1 anaphase-promoting complex subunit 4-like [Drosophila miranda]